MRRVERLRAALVVVLAILALPGAARGAVVALPSGFQEEAVLGGLNQPTGFRFAPNGEVFVAEKGGEILRYENIEDPTPTVFADLREKVYDNGDRGLLGLAIDPEFPVKPYVYALYTFDHLPGPLGDPPGAYPHWATTPPYEGDPCPKPEDADVDACAVAGRLVRLTDTAGVASSEDVLIEDWCQQFSSHSIGDLQFGPEGALYASGGDGASFDSPDYGQFGWPDKNQCGDPPGAAGEELTVPTAEGGSLRALDVLTPADPTGLDGSVIRIDPETGEGLPDNPLASSPDPNARRIVAFGFRNPFRFAIDRENESVYVGNVGNATYEEIDNFPLVPAKAYDSGWPCFEGPDPEPAYRSFGLSLCDSLYGQPNATSQPLFFYPHAAGVTPADHCPHDLGSAIGGSAVYEGAEFPAEYQGALFFADAVRGCIYVMLPGADGEPDPNTVRPFLSDGGPYTGADLQVGPEGSLFYLSLYGDEDLHRIHYDPDAPVARISSDKQWGGLPLKVKFDASASTDPQDETLSYGWDLNGDGTFEVTGAGPVEEMTYAAASNVTVTVKVEDETGHSSIAQVLLYPGDTPPRVEIDEPDPALTWSVGDSIHFEGTAFTEEGSGPEVILPALSWRTTLLHCPGGAGACHEHPLQVFPSTGEGDFRAPEHDYPSRIRIFLTATDERGLSATGMVELQPQAVTLHLDSEPPGVTLTAGTLTQPGPFDLTAIRDGHISIAAPPSIEVDGRAIDFKRWSDGGTRVHTVTASESGDYTAIYEEGEASVEAPGLVAPAAAGDRSSAGKHSLQIQAHPPKRTRKRIARFAFALPGAGVSYRCRLDRQKVFTRCRSPRVLRGLKPGRHVFEVRATVGGHTGKAVRYAWRVLRR